MKSVSVGEFERVVVVVDTTVQEKAIAHPTDSWLPQVAREKIARLAKQVRIKLKLTHQREGKALRRRARSWASCCARCDARWVRCHNARRPA